MKRIDFRWPEAKAGVLTTSWDDGTTHDRRLVEIFNKYGIKGTFNLNSGKFGLDSSQSGWEAYISKDEVAALYAGHEVAVHTVTHPWLQRQSSDMILGEVIEDRRNLENIVGYPVKGMALPFGSQDARVSTILKAAGIKYVRPTAVSNSLFELPGDFMNWTVTCHHKADLKLLWKEFSEYQRTGDKIFYLWGHSYEFNRDGNWEHIEEFCELASQSQDIWFATNMEVFEYVNAWRQLECSVDGGILKNTSSVAIYFSHAGKAICISPGETLKLQ